MRPEDLARQAALLVADFLAEGKPRDDGSPLASLASAAIQDAAPDQRTRLLVAPESHVGLVADLLLPRVFQARYRRAMEAVLGRGTPTTSHGNDRVFFSYHRTGAGDLVRHLADRLKLLGGFDVFLDQVSLAAGPFPPRIEAAVRGCDAFVLVVAQGTPERLHMPDDWVRRETLLAFDTGKPVIPLCVRGCRLPGATDLPPGLGALADLNRIEFHPDSREGFEAGFITLVRWLRQIGRQNQASNHQTSRLRN